MERTKIGGSDPTPEDLAKLQADMDRVTAVANAAIAKDKADKMRAASTSAPSSKPSETFLTKEAFAGLPWWQVILGGVGTLAITAGIASLVLGGKNR